MKRPTCVHCGKPHGKRRVKSEYLVWPNGEPVPAQVLPGDAVKLDYHKKAGDDHGSGTFMGKPFTPNDNVAVRDVWNGEWVTSYDPFCTLRCALSYARRAYAHKKMVDEQNEFDAKMQERWK